MPTYVYDLNCKCPVPEEWPQGIDTVELNVPIAERDEVRCPTCKQTLKRKVAFTGLTWAPTAGGMR